jgi:hypothetical protein
MDTDHKQRESGNAPGWNWIPEQRIHLWWDGERYTARADWDGAQWQVSQIPVSSEPVRTPREHLLIACWYLVLTGLGLLTLSFGGLFRMGSGTECNPDELDGGRFFLLWLVGIAVGAVGAVTLNWRFGAKREALLLIGGAVALPLLMLIGAATNCSNY